MSINNTHRQLIMRKLFITSLLTCLVLFSFGQRKKQNTAPPKEDIALPGLKFRSIGPAITSGRISDFAVNPDNPKEYYVATSAGGVWKTKNAGTNVYTYL